MVKVNYAGLRAALPGLEETDPPRSLGRRQAAVCLPLFDRAETHVLAIQKTDSEGYHWRNQVAFPGGHVDPQDRAATDAALRELEEELGIARSEVEVLGGLGRFPTHTTNVEVAVVVARWQAKNAPRVNPREVARVLELPLSELVDQHARKGFRGLAVRPGDRLPAYAVRDARIWGVTARILHSFLEVLLNQHRDAFIIGR